MTLLYANDGDFMILSRIERAVLTVICQVLVSNGGEYQIL